MDTRPNGQPLSSVDSLAVVLPGTESGTYPLTMGIIADSFKATLDQLKALEDEHQREIQAMLDDINAMIEELDQYDPDVEG